MRGLQAWVSCLAFKKELYSIGTGKCPRTVKSSFSGSIRVCKIGRPHKRSDSLREIHHNYPARGEKDTPIVGSIWLRLHGLRSLGGTIASFVARETPIPDLLRSERPSLCERPGLSLGEARRWRGVAYTVWVFQDWLGLLEEWPGQASLSEFI